MQVCGDSRPRCRDRSGFCLRYHDYRDSPLSDYLPAFEALAAHSSVVRAGACVAEALPTTLDDRIIDYASHHRKDFTDVALCSKCTFFLGDTAGYHCLAMVFRRLLALVNMVLLEFPPTWGASHLFIPKLAWSVSEHRLLTFQETFQSGVSRLKSTDDFARHHIELVNNSSDEIFGLALEQHARLNGTWINDDEDEALQKKFWAMFPRNEMNETIGAHIGAEFLRNHRELLH